MSIWRICPKHKQVYNWILGCDQCTKKKRLIVKKVK
jgi:hypothetical protein